LYSCPNQYPSTTGLHYVSLEGDDENPGTLQKPWGSFQKACENVSPGDTVYIRGGTYTERLIIRSSGTAEEPILFAAYPGETPIIDGETIEIPDAWGGLIQASEKNHIRIRGFTIKNAKGFAIFAVDGEDIIIENNLTDNSWGSGILAWGDRDLIIRGNEVSEASTLGYQEAISISHSNEFELYDNDVHNCHLEGIDVKGGSRNGTIHGNTVHDFNLLGIYVDAWDGDEFNINVFDNLVYACAEGIRVNTENGGIARDIRVYGNTVRDCTGNGFWVGVGGVKDVAHTVRDVEFFKNSSYNNRIGMTISVPINSHTENIKVFNNLIYKNSYNGIMVDDNSSRTATEFSTIRIINNTVWGNGFENSFVDPTEWAHGGIFITAPNVQDVLVRNNIVSGNKNFNIAVHTEVPASVVTIDHNLIYSETISSIEAAGTDTVQGNPLFLNEAGGDFRLSPNSPTIDMGVSLNEDTPSTDYAGNPRPKGAGVDIGAYECY